MRSRDLTSSRKTPRDRVKSGVKRLSKLNAMARKSGQPGDRALYHVKLYGCARKWAKGADAASLAKTLGGVSGGPTTPGFIVGLLLRTSVGDDRRLRFKHGAALRYAASNGVKAVDLIEFLKANGGYNGCAARFSESKRVGSDA